MRKLIQDGELRAATVLHPLIANQRAFRIAVSDIDALAERRVLTRRSETRQVIDHAEPADFDIDHAEPADFDSDELVHQLLATIERRVEAELDLIRLVRLRLMR